MKITFPLALLLLFIGLKLGGIIDWNWVWVLSPVWVPLAIVAALRAIVFLARLFESENDRKIRNVREALNGMQSALRRNRQ